MKRQYALKAFLVLLITLFAHPVFAEVDKAQVKEKLGRVRLPFIANLGQLDKEVAYYATTFAGTLFVTNKGQLVYAFPGRRDDSSSRDMSGAQKGWGNRWTMVKG